MSRFDAMEKTLTELPGSTRSVALMRIGMPLIAWAEVGHDVAPHKAGWLMGGVFFLATTAMLVGWESRIATLLSAIMMWIVIQQVPGTMHHHTYLLTTAMTCLALTPCGKSFSVDRWRAMKRAIADDTELPAEHGNLWALRLIAFQVSALFFWGGFNKLTLGTQSFHTAFLTGDRIEQTLVYYYSLPVDPPRWFAALIFLLGASVTCFEVFAGIGLWIPRARPWVLLGCIFMTTSFQLLLNVGTFGSLAALHYLSFIPPQRVHDVIEKLFARADEEAT